MALPRLPKFSNSLLIHEPKNGSRTAGVFKCNKPILAVVLLVLITLYSCLPTSQFLYYMLAWVSSLLYNLESIR